MTREEFNAKVMEQFNKYKAEMLTQSPERLFNCAYEIAKMTALKDYFTEIDDFSELNKLYLYADNILNMLYEYEWNYDEAQWNSWDDIYFMILDFIKEEN